MEDKKELFCSFSYCMKHKCHGCKNERKCDEWDSRNKRDSNDFINSIVEKYFN